MFSTALRLETRADGENKKNVLVGHAAVFNQRTNLGYFDEVIKRGAFKNTLAEGADVRALVDHDPSRIIGRTKDGGKTGTLRMRTDRIGLLTEIEVADTQAGRDLMESVRRGDIDGMSFGFYVRKNGDNVVEESDGTLLRELRDLDLFDVSAVGFPAYSQTDIAEKNSNTPNFEARTITDVYDSIPEELKERAEESRNKLETSEEVDMTEDIVSKSTSIDESDLTSTIKRCIQEAFAELEETGELTPGTDGEKKEDNNEGEGEVTPSEVESSEDEGRSKSSKEVSEDSMVKLIAQRKREILSLEHQRDLL